MRRNTHSMQRRRSELVYGRGSGLGELSQSVADGKGRRRGPVLTACLVEDVGQVMGDRFLAQTQLPGDLGVGQPTCHKA